MVCAYICLSEWGVNVCAQRVYMRVRVCACARVFARCMGWSVMNGVGASSHSSRCQSATGAVIYNICGRARVLKHVYVCVCMRACPCVRVCVVCVYIVSGCVQVRVRECV